MDFKTRHETRPAGLVKPLKTDSSALGCAWRDVGEGAKQCNIIHGTSHGLAGDWGRVAQAEDFS